MMNVPLSPEEEQEVAIALSVILLDIDDPLIRASFEKQVRSEAQAGANASAQNRIYFREELAFAENAGYADPVDYAQTIAAHRSRLDVLESRGKRALRQAKSFTVNFANRAASRTEKASRTARHTPRRRLQADKKFLMIIGVAEKEGRPTTSGSVGADIQRAIPGYRLPHWEKTTLPLKVLALSVESHRQGAHTINLRLSKEIDEAARRSPRGIVSYMQDRIRKALKDAFADDAPEFWFVLERDDATRFHLHGAVIVPQSGCEPMIDDALRKAGGSWAQKSFQQVGSKLNDPIWWAHYTIKSLNMTVLDIDTRLFASTLAIRQAAREGWDGLRLKLQLKTSSATAPSAALSGPPSARPAASRRRPRSGTATFS
jgi:hypothetical protein